MKERSFDEMIAYFNSRVADMDISQDCKIELFGMIAAIEYKHKMSVPQWIPCSEPPKESGTYIVTAYDGTDKRVTFVKYQKTLKRWDLTGARAYWRILAYKPLPEPWRGEDHEADRC